jgi:hypothetical protein
MRQMVLLAGITSLVFGALFTGQGLGFIRWPESSFMIDSTRWVYYGAAMAIVGAILLTLSRRF